MKIETKNLVRISTYASSIKKCNTWVRKLINEGKLKSVKIDGVTFVFTERIS